MGLICALRCSGRSGTLSKRPESLSDNRWDETARTLSSASFSPLLSIIVLGDFVTVFGATRYAGFSVGRAFIGSGLGFARTRFTCRSCRVSVARTSRARLRSRRASRRSFRLR